MRWIGAFDDSGKVLCGFDDTVSLADGWNWERVVLEFPSICQASSSRFKYTFDYSIVFESWSVVPCLYSMIVPSASAYRFQMH